jgi:radical SAM-linked protein
MVAMVAESIEALNAHPPKTGVSTSQTAAPRLRYRLRFRKDGDLRLVSHHDLMHVFERMLRRAQLPIAQTQGFHPQPRLVFALSLALGVAGNNEVVELELTEALEPDALLARLARQAPQGLQFLSCRRLEGKSSALVRRAFYRLRLPTAALDETAVATPAVPRDLSTRCTELLEHAHLWVHRSRPQPRKLDIRPYLGELHVEGGQLELAVWVTPTGTARPEEYAHLLGLGAVLEAGVFFERTHLEMMDEVAAPTMEFSTQPEELADDEGAELTPALKPAARPTALVSGPLSFDS